MPFSDLGESNLIQLLLIIRIYSPDFLSIIIEPSPAVSSS